MSRPKGRSARTRPPLPPGTIRDLHWEDFSAITGYYFEFYDERDRGLPLGITLFHRRPSLEAEAEWFSRLYRDVISGRTVAVVAEVEGRAVGLCAVNPPGGPESETSHVGVVGIALQRDHRGRGIGEQMLRGAIVRSRGKFEMLTLSVLADNARARRLYRRLGFRTSGRTPRAHKRAGAYTDVEQMYLPLG